MDLAVEHKVINEHASVKYQPRPVDMCMCCHGVGVLDFKLQMLEDMCLNTGFYIELGIGNHELRDLGLWGRGAGALGLVLLCCAYLFLGLGIVIVSLGIGVQLGGLGWGCGIVCGGHMSLNNSTNNNNHTNNHSEFPSLRCMRHMLKTTLSLNNSTNNNNHTNNHSEFPSLLCMRSTC